MQRTLYLMNSWDFTKEGDFEWYPATFLSSLLFLIANVNGKFIGHRKKRNCERCALKSRHSFWLASVYRGEVHKKIPYSNAMITWTVEWIHGKSRERGIYPQRVCDLIKDEASIISIIHLIVCGLHGACKRTSCTTGGRSIPATSTYMQSFFISIALLLHLRHGLNVFRRAAFQTYHQSIQSSSLIPKED